MVNVQQGAQRRYRAFFFDQERRVDRARRIIHGDDQVELRAPRKPSCLRAVLVKHHALPRLALALAAVRSTPLGALHKARRMQLRFRPRVAPSEAVIAHQVLVEMLHVPTPVRIPVKLQHQPNVRRRNPELPLRHPKQLAGFHHRQLASIPAAQNISKLLHPAVL